jgi:xanthine/CO dehydrogenase XdhC/CoxF family maturation factor
VVGSRRELQSRHGHAYVPQRAPGAALAVSAGGDHEVVGSVSGGCVKGAVYELSLDVCETGTPVLQTYGVSDDDAFAVGLTCGGIIDIFVERVGKASFPELGGGRHHGLGTGPGRRAPRHLGA